MAVFRVMKSKDYTVMSNYHLKDNNLSLKAKGLLSVILSLPEEWDYSVSGLVSIVKESTNAVENALKELKQAGYIKVTKLLPNETKSGRIEYIYDIFETPNEEDHEIVQESLKESDEETSQSLIVPSEEPQKMISYEKTVKKQDTDFQGVEVQEVEKQVSDIQGVELQEVENQGQLNTYISNTYKLNTNNKKLKENTKETFVSLLDSYTNNSELRSALDGFVEMRKAMKGFTPRALKLNLHKLDSLANSDEEKIQIVNQTVENGWKGFYSLKEPRSEPSKKVAMPDYWGKEQEQETMTDAEMDDLLRLQKEMSDDGKQEEIDPDIPF